MKTHYFLCFWYKFWHYFWNSNWKIILKMYYFPNFIQQAHLHKKNYYLRAQTPIWRHGQMSHTSEDNCFLILNYIHFLFFFLLNTQGQFEDIVRNKSTSFYLYILPQLHSFQIFLSVLWLPLSHWHYHLLYQEDLSVIFPPASSSSASLQPWLWKNIMNKNIMNKAVVF